MAEHWSVRVTKDYTIFSAAHFITYGSGNCERLHGHNYRVWAELHGPLDENAYVFDFISLKDLLKEITAELDHRLILPQKNPYLTVEMSAEEIIARHGSRQWIAPKSDCVVLPIPNTTAEMLAHWIGQQLLQLLNQRHHYRPQRLVVEVEENVGQVARYQWDPS
jgi:6-pyruvoyltetrahydropterin/6-carboxytetrahydropterin synthase